MTDEERDNVWRRIEQAAREQNERWTEENHDQPLGFGDKVAWVTSSYAKTDGVSAIHRIRNPDLEEGTTFCGEPLPHAKLRFPNLKSLDVCRQCQYEWASALTGLTAKSA